MFKTINNHLIQFKSKLTRTCHKTCRGKRVVGTPGIWRVRGYGNFVTSEKYHLIFCHSCNYDLDIPLKRFSITRGIESDSKV